MRQSGDSSLRDGTVTVKRPSVSKENGEPNRSRGESRDLSIAEGEVMVCGACGNAPTSRHGVRGTSGKAGCGIRCSNRTRVSQTRRSGASARQEAVPRQLSTGEQTAKASTRPRGKGVPTPNPARRRAQARHPNRVLRITPRVHAKFSSSADLVIEVSGVPTRNEGDARCSRCSRATYVWARRGL
jgi:hypothetical protein